VLAVQGEYFGETRRGHECKYRRGPRNPRTLEP
jgi:hypothetical protein